MDDVIEIHSCVEESNCALMESVSAPPISRNNLVKLASYLSEIPAIWNTISDCIPKDKILVADIPANIQRLLDSGELALGLDKSGEMLAQVKDGGKIVKQLRLKEVSQNTDIFNNIQNLHIQSTLGQIVNAMREIHAEVLEVLGTIQDDRYALCDSAERQLIHARLLKSEQMKCQCYALILQTAEDGKNKLMRSMKRDIEFIKNKPVSFWDELKTISSDSTKQRLTEIEQGFFVLTKTATIEAMAFSDLGEHEALISSINHLLSFYNDELDENVLLRLNSHAEEKKKDFFVLEFPKKRKEIQLQISELMQLPVLHPSPQLIGTRSEQMQ